LRALRMKDAEKIIERKPEEIPGAAAGETAQRKVTEEMVWEALKQCYDPEIPVNIVDLGLVYELGVEEVLPGEANIFIRMTLTAPGCGMGPMIAADVKRRVQQIPGVSNVLVDLVFDPIWNPDMMTEAAKLVLNMY
jgi:probable FeS assembly SUF system protein SufT